MSNETIYTVVLTSNENWSDNSYVIDAFSWRSSEAVDEIKAEWDNHEGETFPHTAEFLHEVMGRDERMTIVGDNITITVVAATQPQVISLQGFFQPQELTFNPQGLG